MKTMRMLLSAAALWAIAAAPAFAGGADPACILDARNEHKECRNECKDDFLEDKDLCRSVDPACATDCREQRAECSGPFLDLLEACLDVCSAQLAIDKDNCPPQGDPARDACVDQAQLEAYSCRDVCRENPTVREGLKDCHKANRTCMRACPPPQS